MPNQRIQDLTAAGALSGAELVELEQSGGSVKTTTGAIAALGGSGGGGDPYAAIQALSPLHHWRGNDAAGSTIVADTGSSPSAMTATSGGGNPLPTFGAPSITGDGHASIYMPGTAASLNFVAGSIPTSGEFAIGMICRVPFHDDVSQGLFTADYAAGSGMWIWQDSSARLQFTDLSGTTPAAHTYWDDSSVRFLLLNCSRAGSTTTLFSNGIAAPNVPAIGSDPLTTGGGFGVRADQPFYMRGQLSNMFIIASLLTQADIWSICSQLAI